MIRALLILAIVACGPSHRDVALAKTERYHGEPQMLIGLARRAVERKYQLVPSADKLVIMTVGRWHQPEGLVSAQQPAPDQDSVVRRMFMDKSLFLAMKVSLLPESQDWIVHVEAQIQRYNKGMPYLEPIEPGRADVPGWVTGKVDALAWDIHESLRDYAVRP